MELTNFRVETRDTNGKRSMLSFDTRESFYHYAVKQMDSEDEMEILLVTCAIGDAGQQILFSALNNPFIGWEDLAGYLA